MKLSVVIVSYNVLGFLKQCLSSLEEACSHLHHEIIIVDNNSEDGSEAYLQSLSQNNIQTIFNHDNKGFGSAMNQGFKKCKGEYVLILNPDTLVGADALNQCIQRLDEDALCGAVGVRMIDGQGHYLLESKRGLPSWKSAFYKFTGLASLFPKSKSFASYYQGHLDSCTDHIVPVLTGAFMMTRKSILSQIGGFDERYFMYGEDIDLSYAITELGLHNIYLGSASIVHFKGESTKKEKSSNAYHFYHSMLLFVKKHMNQNKFFLLSLGGLLSILGLFRWIRHFFNPFANAILRGVWYWLIFSVVSVLWASFFFKDPYYYMGSYHAFSIIGYAVVLSLIVSLRQTELDSLQARLKHTILGLIVILIAYGLLPDPLRSSRAVILLGIGIIMGFELLIFAFQNRLSNGKWSLRSSRPKGIMIGQFADCLPAFEKLRSDKNVNYVGIASQKIDRHPMSVTDLEHLPNYLDVNEINILTINVESISMDDIFKLMTQLGSKFKYLLFSNQSQTVLESASDKRGILTTIEISWSIDKGFSKSAKRTLDAGLSLLFIILSPILIWRINNKKQWIYNIMEILGGDLTWVGYNRADNDLDRLPKIKPGVIEQLATSNEFHAANTQYARHYSFTKDLISIFNAFSSLGNKV